MKLEGTRVVLTEDEGRRLFAEQLPLSGMIERTYPAEADSPWCLLRLDRMFAYQVQDEQTKAFRGFEVRKILIRSRWAGYSIGGTAPTSVFVLLADDEKLFETEKIEAKNFFFDAWAICQNEKRG